MVSFFVYLTIIVFIVNYFVKLVKNYHKSDLWFIRFSEVYKKLKKYYTFRIIEFVILFSIGIGLLAIAIWLSDALRLPIDNY